MTRNSRPMILAGITLSLAVFSGCLGGSLSSDESARNELGIQCEAALKIDGTFTQTLAQPADVFGCWPVGTWRFTTTVVSSDCPSQPQLEQEYVIEVTRDAEETLRYSYANDPAYEKVLLKVSSGAGGICEGVFEVFSPDGKTVVTLHPALQPSGVLVGQGDYTIYDQSKM